MVDRDFKDDFPTGMKKLLTDNECKVLDMLPVINDAFVKHEKYMRDIVLREKYPDDISNLFISGDPAGRLGINLTDQCREYLLSKGPHRPMLDSYPINPYIPVCKQNCFTKSWYNINPFIESSLNLDKVFCFVCSSFGSEIARSENMCKNECKIETNFMSNTHKQSIQKYYYSLWKKSCRCEN